MATQSQPDDNMIPGQTYTFQLKLGNLITLPTAATIQGDLASNAPSFVSNNLQVTVANTLNPFDNTFNIQFTYSGDGTDVISDVANSIIAAIQTGSNDSFSFIGAYADVATNVSSSGIGDTLNATLQNSVSSLGDALNTATQKIANSTQNVLTPVEIAVGIVALLVVALIFTSGKAGGFSASGSGVKVGGR